MSKFGVSPPWYRNDPVEWTAFNLFAMDVEQRQERENAIEIFIHYLSITDDPNDFGNQKWASKHAYLDLTTLSPEEKEYIEQEVAKRWQTV